MSTELRFLPVVEPDVPVAEPRLAEGEEPPWSRGRPDDVPPPVPTNPPSTSATIAPQRLREGIDLVPTAGLRLAVLACAAVLVARDVLVAAWTVDLRVRGAEASTGLGDLVEVAFDVGGVALALGWIAVVVWSVVAVLNGRRIGGWRVSAGSAAIAWAVPAAVYVNPWFDANGPGVGWLVPLGLLLVPMMHTRSIARQVGRSVPTAAWFGITVVWLWSVGRVGAVGFLTDDPDTRITASMILALLAALAALGWWATTRAVLRTIDQGAIERARPVDDLSPAFAMQQAAAAGVDPTAVLRAVRSAEGEVMRRGPVRVEPMGAARWSWAVLSTGLVVYVYAVLGPRLGDWFAALEIDPDAQLPDGLGTAIVLAAFPVIAAGILYLVWGVLVLQTARRLGEREAQPSRWVIGNLIPIVNLFVPYSALRDGTSHIPGAPAVAGRWQATTIMAVVVSFITAAASVRLDSGSGDDPSALATALDVVGLLCAVVIYGVAFVSMWQIERAVRRRAAGDVETSNAVSGTGPLPGV